MDKKKKTEDRRQRSEFSGEDMKTMILDYMEKGFLENIIDMFRHDESLFPLIIDMIKDRRVRVRLGATALVEEVIKQRPEPLVRLIPDIAKLLNDEDPVVRGDGANLLDIIKHKDALPFLLGAEHDDDRNVREIVKEAIRNIYALN